MTWEPSDLDVPPVGMAHDAVAAAAQFPCHRHVAPVFVGMAFAGAVEPVVVGAVQNMLLAYKKL